MLTERIWSCNVGIGGTTGESICENIKKELADDQSLDKTHSS